jgi:hypothetical protein
MAFTIEVNHAKRTVDGDMPLLWCCAMNSI